MTFNHNAVSVRVVASIADHDVPTDYRSAVICARSKPKSPLTQKATAKVMFLVPAFHRTLCSATMAARTASAGDVTGGRCNTAKNRRLSLPPIGDD